MKTALGFGEIHVPFSSHNRVGSGELQEMLETVPTEDYGIFEDSVPFQRRVTTAPGELVSFCLVRKACVSDSLCYTFQLLLCPLSFFDRRRWSRRAHGETSLHPRASRGQATFLGTLLPSAASLLARARRDAHECPNGPASFHGGWGTTATRGGRCWRRRLGGVWKLGVGMWACGNWCVRCTLQIHEPGLEWFCFTKILHTDKVLHIHTGTQKMFQISPPLRKVRLITSMFLCQQ